MRKFCRFGTRWELWLEWRYLSRRADLFCLFVLLSIVLSLRTISRRQYHVPFVQRDNRHYGDRILSYCVRTFFTLTTLPRTYIYSPTNRKRHRIFSNQMPDPGDEAAKPTIHSRQSLSDLGPRAAGKLLGRRPLVNRKAGGDQIST
jgi:hypothetical protein